MRNLIAFSLYGNKDIYLSGALANAKSVKDFYPGWELIFYCGESVPAATKQGLKNLGAQIVEITGPEDYSSASWRFQAALIPDAGRVLFRDCDSRFTEREAAAVQAWINSELPLHIMRDHPNHLWEIQAGMFGVIPNKVPQFTRALSQISPKNYYGQDQDFLRCTLYENYKKRALIHDSISLCKLGKNAFPTTRSNLDFVGQIVDEFSQKDKPGRDALAKFYASRQFRFITRSRILIHRQKSWILDRISRFSSRP